MNFDAFLHSLTSTFTPVVDSSYLPEEYSPIDLSSANPSLKDIDTSSAEAIEVFLQQELNMKEKKVAYGGYLEQRSLYDRSQHFSSTSLEEPRNIHLGMDVWCPSGTSVLLPLDGKIHSFNDNKAYGDYGPTILVEHHENQRTFYTLYGHLSLESLAQIRVGTAIKKGAILAKLGDASVNGDYAPHLHFQVIKDLQNYRGDYPGVCSKGQLDFYALNCPDPNLLLKIY